jgi:S1-C subfamily serine protease
METLASKGASALQTLSNELAACVAQAGRVVVAVYGRPGTPSSGVHWRRGVIVTADHTIQRDGDIRVELPDGDTVPAELAGRDEQTDLAVLLPERGAFVAAERGDPAKLRVGHIVLALARPGERGLSASCGVVSAVGGRSRTWYGGRVDRLLHLDLTIYPGFSGGPLVDAHGRVMGINTTGPGGRVVTIPRATVDRVVDGIVESERGLRS